MSYSFVTEIRSVERLEPLQQQRKEKYTDYRGASQYHGQAIR